MLVENNNNGGADTNITPKPPLTPDAEDPSQFTPTGDDDEGGEAEEDESFSWGFEDIFKQDTPEEPIPKDTPPAEGEQPSKVDLLEQEVARLREEARVRQGFEQLESKYGGMEGFPEVDKNAVMKFLREGFGKMDPLEIGYILNNFGEILKNAKASTKAKIENQYSPEVTAQQAQVEKQSAMSDRMKAIGENIRRQYGIQKEEQ